jgi:hypothetical protein
MGRQAEFRGILLLALGFSLFGCSGPDNGDTESGPDGTDGTSTSLECEAFDATNDLIVSCEAVLQYCPRTLDEFFPMYVEPGWGTFTVLEGDGLRQVSNGPNLGGVAFAFDDAGMLAGWQAWNDIAWGPCESSYRSSYERGRVIHISLPGPSVHRCDLADDARETGVLCDCPCPDPAPSSGIYEDAGACLSVGRWPRCEETFVRQREIASGGSMRSGCGIRTITLDANDCSYDASGVLVGGERHRSDDPSNECPGVDVYRTGDLAECDEETTCHFGEPPAGSSPCPLD